MGCQAPSGTGHNGRSLDGASVTKGGWGVDQVRTHRRDCLHWKYLLGCMMLCSAILLSTPVPARRAEHIPSKFLRAHGVLESEPMVTRHSSGETERLGTCIHAVLFVLSRQPGRLLSVVLPWNPAERDRVRGQERFDEIQNR